MVLCLGISCFPFGLRSPLRTGFHRSDVVHMSGVCFCTQNVSCFLVQVSAGFWQGTRFVPLTVPVKFVPLLLFFFWDFFFFWTLLLCVICMFVWQRVLGCGSQCSPRARAGRSGRGQFCLGMSEPVGACWQGWETRSPSLLSMAKNIWVLAACGLGDSSL